MKVKILLSLKLVLFLGLNFVWYNVRSCSCQNKNSIYDAYESADVIVQGKVISITQYIASEFPFTEKFNGTVKTYKYKVSIVIKKNLKGDFDKGDTIIISTGLGGGDCGFKFGVGEYYIVYGMENNLDQYANFIEERKKWYKTHPGSYVRFETGICNRTKIKDRKEIKSLRKIVRKGRNKVMYPAQPQADLNTMVSYDVEG